MTPRKKVDYLIQCHLEHELIERVELHLKRMLEGKYAAKEIKIIKKVHELIKVKAIN